MKTDTISVRDSTGADIPRITAIYARSVLEETASFELTPPGDAEMAQRRRELVDRGFPYFVAESGGEVVGYAYAGLFRGRPAYGWTCENTVYVDPAAQRQGVARRLMERIIGESERIGFRQMMSVIAVVGDPEKSASIRLHRSLGFEDVGRNRAVGYKFGVWIDTYHLQLPLGDGDTTPPGERPGA